MKTAPLGNASLLVLLTAAIAACGSTGTNATGSGGGTSTTTTPGSGGAGGSASASSSASSSSSGAGGHGGAATSTSSTGGAGGGLPTPRRPFLVGASLRSARAVPSDDWARPLPPPAPALDPATAALLARSWLQDALEEHASVAAFARLTLQLVSVGAPPDLLERSQRASLDEIRHARACFALAARYGGRAEGPTPLRVHDSLGAVSLVEIAALAAEEGCVGETLGAALAQEQLAVATDPEVRAALERIAADEARHAELAWRFLRWAVLEGGAPVERAVVSAVERALEATWKTELRSYDGIDLDAFHAHGRLTCLEARAAAERAAREVVGPCLALALAGEAPELARHAQA
jgi:hypothetical protein